jgi:hypothetical protein
MLARVKGLSGYFKLESLSSHYFGVQQEPPCHLPLRSPFLIHERTWTESSLGLVLVVAHAYLVIPWTKTIVVVGMDLPASKPLAQAFP